MKIGDVSFVVSWVRREDAATDEGGNFDRDRTEDMRVRRRFATLAEAMAFAREVDDLYGCPRVVRMEDLDPDA